MTDRPEKSSKGGKRPQSASQGGSRSLAALSPARRSHAGSFDSDVTAMLVQVVGALLDGGDALLIGATRDMGAICLTLIHGDERAKLYSSNAEELFENLSRIHDHYRLSAEGGN